MRKARRLTRLIIAVPILAMVIGSLVFMARVGQETERRLPEVIKAAVSERIKGTVSIGKVHVSPTSAVIHDFVISESVASPRPVIRIPQLKIKYGLSAMFMGNANPMETVRSIEIREPEIYLEHRADGSWNIAELLKPTPSGKPSKMQARIYVRSGKIIIRDLEPKKTVENIVTDIHATADMSGSPMVKFTATGKGEKGRFGSFSSRGWYDTRKHSFLANVEFSGASASYWAAYPWDIRMQVTSGVFDGKIELSKAGRDKQFLYSGTLRARQGSLILKQIRTPIKDVNGDLELRNGVVGVKFEGRLNSAPVIVTGHVLDKPDRLALEVTSTKANFREIAKRTEYAKLLSKVTLPTTGSLKATVYGSPENPGISFQVTMPSVTYAGIKASSIAVDGLYFNERVRLRSASCRTCGGKIEASGDINLAKSPSAKLEGRVTNLDLRQIPALRKQRITAVTTGNFRSTLKQGTTYVHYQGKVDNGQLDRIKVNGVNITAEYLNGAIKIQDISLRAFDGLMSMSGHIERNGEMKILVAGVDINMAPIAGTDKDLPVAGKAYFTGEITGPLDEPVFRGEVGAYDVMASGVEVEHVSGSVVASRDLVDVDNFVISKYPGTVTLSGRINDPFSEAPTVHMSAQVRSIDMEQITQSKGIADLTGGVFSGQVSVDGPISNPLADLQLRIENISYLDMLVDSVEAQASYEHRSLQIEQLDVQMGNSTLVANGNVSKDGLINVGFNSDKFSLSRFASFFRPYVFAFGTMAVSGNISGTLSDPKIEAKVDCVNPSINGQKFTHFNGKALWNENTLTLSDTNLFDGDAKYGIPLLTFNQKSRMLELGIRVQDAEAQKVLAILDTSPAVLRPSTNDSIARDFLARIPRPLHGKVDCTLTGNMRMLDSGIVPNIQTEIAVDNMKCGTSTINTVRLKASWKDEIIRLEKLEALDEDTNVEANGTFGPANALDFTVDAHNLTLDTLRQWVAIPDNLSGSADVTIVASGDINAPQSEAFIELVDPIIGGVKFERLRSRLSTNTNLAASTDGNVLGRVDIDDITLTLNGRDFRASGYIPVDWRHLTIPRDVPRSVEATLDSDSLAVLSAFSGTGLETGSKGEFRGFARLGGTIRSPKLEGEIIWRDGLIRPPKMESAFENIDMHITLGDDKLAVEKFMSTPPGGGKLEASGQISLPDMKPSLDLAVKTTDYAISGRNLSHTYGEVVKAIVNSDLKITGEYNRPLISGTVDMPKGSFELPARTQKQQNRAVEKTFNPTFDIKKVSLGKNVQFKFPRFKTPLYGNLAISGSMQKPVVEGAMDISGGTIQFPVHAFKIMQGSNLNLHVGSPPQPPVYIDMRAQTRLTAKTSTMRSRRYAVTMTARGPIDNLNPTFSSSPPGLPEESIMALVTGQNQLEQIFGQNDSGSMISGLFSTAMVPSMVLPIEEAFENALGFEDFSLQLGYHEPTQLTVSEQLLDGVYLDYSAAIGARPDYADSRYELKLSRRFKYGLEFGIQTDEDSTITIGIEGKLRF